ncbi:hypothetical protein [Luteolibacter sp. Populi]|uniref:hypothetical protein n=1 Tax=Luteolibacter sp. Populi TaxID=3230487 RepID=UPI003466B698
MRAAHRNLLFAAACLAGLGAGVFLGGGREVGVAAAAVASSSNSRLEAGVPQVLEAGAEAKPGSVPVTRQLLLRRTLAACETAALWEWLGANPEGDGYITSSVISELIDRLGWGAWEHALAVGDPKTREKLAAQILAEFARRDPWKAYAEWQKHRAEFEDPEWGAGVIEHCTLAASAISADKLLEMFQQLPKPEAENMMVVEFAKDFDFRKVLDDMMTSGKRPYTLAENLVPKWAERSPEEAAAWLGEHPDYFKEDYHEAQASGVLKAIANAGMSDEARRKALGAMANLSDETLDQAWHFVTGNSDGKVSASVLQSAEMMGQREDYLRRLLLETRTEEELDGSWNQVPLGERREVLAAAEREWAEKNPMPLDAKSRAHWLKMVTTAWGISP